MESVFLMMCLISLITNIVLFYMYRSYKTEQLFWMKECHFWWRELKIWQKKYFNKDKENRET